MLILSCLDNIFSTKIKIQAHHYNCNLTHSECMRCKTLRSNVNVQFNYYDCKKFLSDFGKRPRSATTWRVFHFFPTCASQSPPTNKVLLRVTVAILYFFVEFYYNLNRTSLRKLQIIPPIFANSNKRVNPGNLSPSLLNKVD